MFQEDYVRADAYGLISSLLAAPPDQSFLKLYAARTDTKSEADAPGAFTLQQPDPSPYEAALRALQDACAQYDEAQIAQEYDALFRQPGPSVLSVAKTAEPSQAQLATLRSYLAGMGLPAIQSDGDVTRYIAAACQVMRWLLENDKPVELQSQFFLEFAGAGVTGICDAIEENPSASFYRAVSALARTFVENEHAKFAAQEPG